MSSIFWRKRSVLMSIFVKLLLFWMGRNGIFRMIWMVRSVILFRNGVMVRKLLMVRFVIFRDCGKSFRGILVMLFRFWRVLGYE